MYVIKFINAIDDYTGAAVIANSIQDDLNTNTDY